jgi:triacylglycerol esterase/lipase EstA (alpha/beta hydrolase family)
MTIQEYSQDFRTLMDSDNTLLDDKALSQIRNDFFIVFVRGFLGNVGALLPGGYFREHKKWLANRDIDAYIIDKIDGFDTENDPSLNASAIKKLVESIRIKHPEKKILFITHSKGGIDVLATLLNHPGLLKHSIGGWIALQTPFEGTALADIVTSTSISRFFVSAALTNLLGGSKNGLNSLRTKVRKKIMKTNLNVIEDIVKEVPVLTFGSAFNSYRNVLTVTMLLQNDPNDGVVPLKGTLLKKNEDPLCSYIKAKSIDHLETVIIKPKFNRQRFLDVLLKLWLDTVGVTH